ncbi:MAG: DNA double-strand break repair protein Mre11, partial [Cyanobacteria bacterium P01_H01_bin.121]
ALGHIHKNYELEGWIFNPGSLEANSIAESREQIQRGAYLVELDQGTIQAQLCQDYQQRPILRLVLEADKQWTQAEFEHALGDCVQVAATAGQTVDAIVELRIRGQISFNRLDLNLRELRDRLQASSQALIFLLKYEATETTYQTPLPQTNQPARAVIEATVFQDLLAAQSAYAPHLEPLTQGLVSLKHDILAGASEPELYEYVADVMEAIALPISESCSAPPP